MIFYLLYIDNRYSSLSLRNCVKLIFSHFSFNKLRKENSGIYKCQVDLSPLNGSLKNTPQILEKEFALTIVGDDPADFILV